jgi:hypothetical protein
VVLYNKCDELFGCFPADLKFEETVVVGAALLLTLAGGLVVWNCTKEDRRTGEQKQEDEAELLELQKAQKASRTWTGVKGKLGQVELQSDAVMSILPASSRFAGTLRDAITEAEGRSEGRGGETDPELAPQQTEDEKEDEARQAADAAWQTLWTVGKSAEEKAEVKVAKAQAKAKAKARLVSRKEQKARGRPVFAHLLAAEVAPAGPPAAPHIVTTSSDGDGGIGATAAGTGAAGGAGGAGGAEGMGEGEA